MQFVDAIGHRFDRPNLHEKLEQLIDVEGIQDFVLSVLSLGKFAHQSCGEFGAIDQMGLCQDGGARGARGGIGFRCAPAHASSRLRFQTANDAVDTRSLQLYIGHKNIQHTVRYTELSATRFKDFWRD